jgi:DNA helicase-2/ATP-dependent DNA helicase PcrA
LQFERDFQDTKTYKLEQNYRSTQPIVSAANQVITFNKKQIQKEIWTDQEGEHKISLMKAISDSDEGRMVSNAIVEYKNRYHLANRDVAILYRTNAQSRIFEEHLRRNNLAYRVFGGLSFYQRKEVKDLLAYMRLAVNPKDDEAFRRVINYPRRGVGKTTINQISDAASQAGISMWEIAVLGQVPNRARSVISEFVKVIKQFQSKSNSATAYDAAIFIVKKSGVYDLLKEDTSIEGKSRLENVNALLDGIKSFIDDDELSETTDVLSDKSLVSYIQNIALLTDFDTEETEQDYISLMSAHAAKGLEFKAVFVVGLEENLFPSFLSQGSPDQLDEERRLFYVAITRAEQFLSLSFAKSRYQYGQIRYNDPSRFLEEINENLFESSATIRERPTFSKPKLLGGLRKKTIRRKPVMDPSQFTPSPVDDILQGVDVLHLTFGKGRVKAVDGAKGRRIATIEFSEIEDKPEKKIVLRFAKLQVLQPESK